MLSPRLIQVIAGTISIFVLFSIFGHGSQDVIDNGNPRPAGAYEGLKYRIASHIKPFFNEGSSTLSKHLERSEQIYQRMVSQRAGLASEYPKEGEKKL